MHTVRSARIVEKNGICLQDCIVVFTQVHSNISCDNVENKKKDDEVKEKE